jgi:hypothetical protein
VALEVADIADIGIAVGIVVVVVVAAAAAAVDGDGDDDGISPGYGLCLKNDRDVSLWNGTVENHVAVRYLGRRASNELRMNSSEHSMQNELKWYAEVQGVQRARRG